MCIRATHTHTIGEMCDSPHCCAEQPQKPKVHRTSNVCACVLNGSDDAANYMLGAYLRARGTRAFAFDCNVVCSGRGFLHNTFERACARVQAYKYRSLASYSREPVPLSLLDTVSAACNGRLTAYCMHASYVHVVTNVSRVLLDCMRGMTFGRGRG